MHVWPGWTEKFSGSFSEYISIFIPELSSKLILNRAEYKIENEGELIKLIISHEDSPPLKDREDYNCDCMGNTEPTVEQGMNLSHVDSEGNCCVNARLYAYNYLFN